MNTQRSSGRKHSEVSEIGTPRTQVKRSLLSLIAAAMALAALLSSACATTIDGTRQRVKVVSEPPGATASALDQKTTTPGSLILPRRMKTVIIAITKDGYEGVEVVLRQARSGAIWTNLALIPAGIVGGYNLSPDKGKAWFGGWDDASRGGLLVFAAAFAIDVANGSAFRLEPPEVSVTLQPVAGRQAGPRAVR